MGHIRTADTTYAYNLITASISKAHFLTTRGNGDTWGPVYGTRAYNNTVYLTPKPGSTANVGNGPPARSSGTRTTATTWASMVGPVR